MMDQAVIEFVIGFVIGAVVCLGFWRLSRMISLYIGARGRRIPRRGRIIPHDLLICRLFFIRILTGGFVLLQKRLFCMAVMQSAAITAIRTPYNLTAGHFGVDIIIFRSYLRAVSAA